MLQDQNPQKKISVGRIIGGLFLIGGIIVLILSIIGIFGIPSMGDGVALGVVFIVIFGIAGLISILIGTVILYYSNKDKQNTKASLD